MLATFSLCQRNINSRDYSEVKTIETGLNFTFLIENKTCKDTDYSVSLLERINEVTV